MPFTSLTEFDSFFNSVIQSTANPVLTLFFTALTFVGNPAFWFLIATYYYWRGSKREAFHTVLLLFLAAISTDALKAIFRRTRPVPLKEAGFSKKIAELAGRFSRYSFPSGHSATIGAIAGYFAGFVEKRKKAFLVVLVCLVALSRIYLGMHYLSDVIVGVVLGALIGRFVFYERMKSEIKKVQFAFLDGKPMIFIIIATAIAAFLLKTELALYFCLGFFIGFVLLHRSGIKTRIEEKRKMLLGFIGLGFLGITAVMSTEIAKIVISFTAGFWISFIFPLLAQHELKKGLKRLTAKK